MMEGIKYIMAFFLLGQLVWSIAFTQTIRFETVYHSIIAVGPIITGVAICIVIYLISTWIKFCDQRNRTQENLPILVNI